MRSALCLAVLSVCLPAMASPVPPPLKVGVYTGGLGGGAILKVLSREPGVEAESFRQWTPEGLLRYDVVWIGACTLDQPQALQALHLFLHCGGGLVLNHSACGRNRPQTFFPSVVQKVLDRREDNLLRVRDRTHPLAAGLPETFGHAYYDHLFLVPGDRGTVVIADREDSPVVVTGAVGAGRIVFNGALPGYRYDPATFAQGDAEPEGAERRLALNAVRWAGEGRLTGLPPDVLAQRRQKAETELRLAELETLAPKPTWFGKEMLLGSYLPRQPVSELGGRFFITYDSQTWRGYALRRIETPEQLEIFRNRLRADILQLKWLGVTDIILWTDVSGERVWHDTTVPDSQRQCQGVDPLAELIRLATPEGMNVWAAWHSCFRSEGPATKYCAKDGEGKLYKYGGRDFCEDLLSPAYRQRCHRFLDEYAEKYRPLGNFRGLAIYDELWFTYADFHGDDLTLFERFCRERFGEKPPADMGLRLAKGRQWTDTADIWRNRYILFKQQVVTDFWRDLVDYAHQKGLQIGVQLLATANYSSGWCWGMDSVALGRLNADFFNAGWGEDAATSHPNLLRWAHVHDSWGVYNTHCLRGGPGGIFFTFNQLWRLIMYGSNPALPRELARHIHNQRQWAHADPLARVAFLHNQNALQMLLPDPRLQVNRDRALFNAVQRSQDADFIFTQAHERYRVYRLLVATPYSVRGLSEEDYRALRRFVEEGGTVLSVNANWTLSRPDLTQERDTTAEIVGVAYGNTLPTQPTAFDLQGQRVALGADTPRREVRLLEGTRVLARFADGTPAITEKALGKGKVIGVHFGVDAVLEKENHPALAACFASLVQGATQSPITAEGEGFRVISTLKKGNWIAVALYPDQVPCRARLHVDPAALGIGKHHFRLLLLGKQMEIGRPGDLWGETGYWSAEELQQGFTVTLVESHEQNLPLPETFDLSDFVGERGRWQADYLNTVTRDLWDSETAGRRKRTYSHEIVVIAPADEPTMPKP